MKPHGSSINKPGSKYSPGPIIYNWSLFKTGVTDLETNRVVDILRMAKNEHQNSQNANFVIFRYLQPEPPPGNKVRSQGVAPFCRRKKYILLLPLPMLLTISSLSLSSPLECTSSSTSSTSPELIACLAFFFAVVRCNITLTLQL
jgi:hypothetical protein